MGTKSIREAVETAVTAHLTAQSFPAGTQVLPGLSLTKVDPPMVVASVEQVTANTEIPGVLGNFSAQVQVFIVSPANVADALAAHRLLAEQVYSAMADEAGLKAVFTLQGDAAMYFCTFATTEDARGEESFGTTITYDLLGVLNP